jgi:hypothetical protein
VPVAVFGTTIHDETLFKVRLFDVLSIFFLSFSSPLSISLPLLCIYVLVRACVVKHLHAIIPSAVCRL